MFFNASFVTCNSFYCLWLYFSPAPSAQRSGRESQFPTSEALHPLQTTLKQPGIVSARVGLSYDPLRFGLRCPMCVHSCGVLGLLGNRCETQCALNACSRRGCEPSLVAGLNALAVWDFCPGLCHSTRHVRDTCTMANLILLKCNSTKIEAAALLTQQAASARIWSAYRTMALSPYSSCSFSSAQIFYHQQTLRLQQHSRFVECKGTFLRCCYLPCRK